MSPKPLLSWKSWPFAERPLSSSLLIAFLLFLNFFLYRLAIVEWSMPFFYIAGWVLVVGNLLPYFIITEYDLYDHEIRIRYIFIKVKRPWTDFGCFYKDKRGVMLSTFKLPRRLDPFRGLSLRFSKTGAELPALLEILREKIGKEY